jgi:cytochrome c oxidase cbb3-type subunit 2
VAPIRFIVAAALTFTFHAVADQGASGTTPAGEAELRVGRAAFQKVCAECHGSKGRGDGDKAKKLGFAPRNFTLGAFKCRCTPSGQPPTDEDLNRTITRGLPGTPMEGHRKDLTEAERRALVQFVKTLSPRFNAGNLSECQASPNPPPVSPELIAEGGQLYRLMQCGKCHGARGRGDGPAAATLKDDWGQPIRPYDFVERRDFKCGNDDRDVYRTLRTGMTGTPMPSFDEALGFAKDSFGPEQLRTLGNATEARQLQAYLATQPDAAVLGMMAAEERLALVNRRAWSLVQYVRSLLAR